MHSITKNITCNNCYNIPCICEDYCICTCCEYYRKYSLGGTHIINCYRNTNLKENLKFKIIFNDYCESIIMYFKEYLFNWLYSLFDFSQLFAEYTNHTIGYNNFLTIYTIIGKNYSTEEEKNIINDFCNKFSNRYYITRKKQMHKIFEKELIEKTWNPNRFFDWCLSIDEKNDYN